MPMHRQKIGVDYLRQIIPIAERLLIELHKGETAHILPFLKILASVDSRSIDNLLVETQSADLVKATMSTYAETISAIADIERQNSFTGAENALIRIIAIKKLITMALVRPVFHHEDIDYILVTAHNWNLYRDAFIHLEHAAFFGTDLEEEPEDIDRMVCDTENITFAAVKQGVAIAFAIGEPLDAITDVPGPDEDPEHGKGTCLYISDIITLPEYGGKAVSFFLCTLLAKEAARRGYKTLSSNNRQGPSVRNALRMGAKVIKTIPNYFNTGETYYYVKMDLKQYR